MYTYFILLIIIAVIIYANIKLYGFNLLSPSFLYSCSMLISVLCSMIGLLSWNNVTKLSFNTCLIILLSVITFNVGEFFAQKFFGYDKKNKKVIDNTKNISIYKIIIQLLFVVFCFVLVFLEVRRISYAAGYYGSNLFKMIKTYRSTSILFSTKYIESGIHINIIVAQLQKVAEVICYVNIYFLVKSIYGKKLFIEKKKNILYISIIIICILMSLLIGSRLQSFVYILFSIIVYIFFLNKKLSYKTIIFRYWKYLLVGVITVSGLFYVILPLTGRKTNAGIVEYTSFYFGAPIPSLNRYISSPIEKPKIFGEETFRGIQNVAYKLNISDYIQPITTKWEVFYTKDNVKLSSNIYTSGKRYYHDFGYLGLIVLQFINGFMFSILYISMNKKQMTVLTIFFAMYLYMAIDQIRDEYLFSSFVHINTVFKFAILYCLLYFLEHSNEEIKDLFTKIKNKLRGLKNEIKNR